MSYSELTNAIGHCIGYGHMDAEYYFFGLEEKSQVGNVDYSSLYLEHYAMVKGFYAIPNDKFPDESKIIKGNSIYYTYLDLYNRLTKSSIDMLEFLSDKTPILIGNIKPFSKNNSSDVYLDDQKAWVKNNGKLRKSFIYNLLAEESKEKKVFIFGGQTEIRRSFEVLKLEFEEIKFKRDEAKLFLVGKNQKLYLLKHPSKQWRHLTEENQEDFLEYLDSN